MNFEIFCAIEKNRKFKYDKFYLLGGECVRTICSVGKVQLRGEERGDGAKMRIFYLPQKEPVYADYDDTFTTHSKMILFSSNSILSIEEISTSICFFLRSFLAIDLYDTRTCTDV